MRNIILALEILEQVVFHPTLSWTLHFQLPPPPPPTTQPIPPATRFFKPMFFFLGDSDNLIIWLNNITKAQRLVRLLRFFRA